MEENFIHQLVNLNGINLHFSGQDNMILSRDEAQRLKNSLTNFTIHLFKGNGHTFLLVSGSMYNVNFGPPHSPLLSFKD